MYVEENQLFGSNEIAILYRKPIKIHTVHVHVHVCTQLYYSTLSVLVH